MFHGCGDDIARNCTLTVNGQALDLGERIGLGSVREPRLEPEPVYLMITNMGWQPLTLFYHSLGPRGTWEIDVNGKIYSFENASTGSGVGLSREVKPKEAGVIEETLMYEQIPESLRKLILSEASGSTFVDAKVRFTIQIEARGGEGQVKTVQLASNWRSMQVGSHQAPVGWKAK
ncbi:hypothetical protein [Roseimicrobium sp. ORNL1]|uniref:hypothetical protein n=1 Tax=Roseimicrobium sp. ORNL1 TaxID=2711231 RepID=UPI0013E1841B|nr:hypothetical protein [Roseimicrobium sp. ORNL1]QIF03674.1 hypothetical protein G5S37_19830 [Roseimicrobium sp. ORNL1]